MMGGLRGGGGGGGGGNGQILCPRQWYTFLLAVLTKLYYSVHIIIKCW